jgi:hypothetical protein
MYHIFLSVLSLSSSPCSVRSSSSSSTATNKKPNHPVYLRNNNNNNEWFLSTLHGIGSLTTNLGFMYGTAYLVQIIKLLEPLETLLLSAYLHKRSGSTTAATTTRDAAGVNIFCHVGTVCSIVVVIGSAISLIPWRQTNSPSQTHAIVFALISGCSLSLRNVLQQKQHASATLPVTASDHHHHPSTRSHQSDDLEDDDDDDDEGTRLLTAAESAIPTTIKEELPLQQHDVHDPCSKLERSVLQFTKLSFQSGLIMAAVSLVFGMLLVSPPLSATTATTFATTTPTTTSFVWLESLTWNVLLWHPMYNVTSMIVLGWCGSAVTHSLFNAGKRVFSILLALLWMEQQQQHPQQPHLTTTYFRLFMVAVGAIWYTLETNQQQQHQHQQRSNNNSGRSENGHHRVHGLVQPLSSSSSALSSPSPLPITTATTSTNYGRSSWFWTRERSVTTIQNAHGVAAMMMMPWKVVMPWFKVMVCVVMVMAVLYPSS